MITTTSKTRLESIGRQLVKQHQTPYRIKKGTLAAKTLKTTRVYVSAIGVDPNTGNATYMVAASPVAVENEVLVAARITDLEVYSDL
jgi:hypothetical protein